MLKHLLISTMIQLEFVFLLCSYNNGTINNHGAVWTMCQVMDLDSVGNLHSERSFFFLLDNNRWEMITKYIFLGISKMC